MTAPEPPTSAELAELNHQLTYGTLEQRAAAADKLAEIRAAVSIEPVHYVSDRLWNRVGPIGGDLMENSGADPRNNVPTATIKVKGTSELVEHFFGCEQTLVGVEMEVGGLAFPFYVKSHDWEYEKGAYTSTLNCRGIWDILNYLQIWPVWWMPIQFQPFSHAVFFGPLVTVIENMISECAIRIQSGINEFLNNALSVNPDLRAWIGTLLQSNGNIFTALKTPIYVVRTNPFLDTSPLYAKTVRMESCGTVITEITRPYGVDVRVDLWRPGMPQPDRWANLTQVTYVVTVKDRSQVEGPTKIILDSALRTAVDIQGSLLGNLLAPILNPQGYYAPEGVYIVPQVGLNFGRPLIAVVAPRPGAEDPRSPIVKMKVSQHTPMGWNHIVGGKSPRWLNDLINAFLSWIIDAVMILVGLTGIPSDLLSGFLNDSIMAFQVIQLYGRRADVGPYHPGIEVFTATNSAPYNIEALFSFIIAFWDSRGYTAGQLVVRHGEVIALGRDLARGGLMSLVYSSATGAQRLFTDYLELIFWKFSATERDLFLQIGDGRGELPPIPRLQMLVTGLQEIANVIMLTPNS
ncbi:hypothetical protein DSM43518_02018 [Mycobacterium marinum]|uniref:hypothetical protein n=1 Tax=Mycobacterium marinum TaxID=1781 RepID=UPI000E3CC9DE|nr:hypothetical protein [Mycobacterium marinum]RFZ11178.1 hypothetical protein DSM43518_02018 [Mycobacterium marinum]